MKRAWQEYPDVAWDIEDAMCVARSSAFEEEIFCEDECRVQSESDNDSDGEEANEEEDMDAEYVKKNFDRLYVQKVVRWIEEGRNVFVTGSQGRGKSTCIKRVIEELYRKGCKLLVTGSTGTSVVNISDVAQQGLYQAIENDLLSPDMTYVLAPATVHRAFGMRYKENEHLKELREASKKKNGTQVTDKPNETRNATRIADDFMHKYKVRHRDSRKNFLSSKNKICAGVPSIAYAEVVIIDEISMIDDVLMEILDRVGRFWRPTQENLPFGGLVMVSVGDFQQLPPVGSGTRQNPIYLFENIKWTTRTSRQGWVDRVLHLKVNIRQEGDTRYGELLDRMTMNDLTLEDLDLLDQCVMRPANGGSGLEAALNPLVMPGVIRVFNSNYLISRFTRAVMENVDPAMKVALEHREEYEPGKDVIHRAYGREEVQAKVREFVEKATANIDSDFYIGCPVRFLENKDVEEGVVNGAMGKFIGRTEQGKHPIIELKSGKHYTLSRSSAELFVDNYTSDQRRDFKLGRLQPHPNLPVAKVTYKYYPISKGLAMTPQSLQGLTAKTLIIHPNIDYANENTTIECYFTALSRLCSSGLGSPGKEETLRAIPKKTLHPGSSDDSPRPQGLYLTRRAIYPFFVRPKVRKYIDEIEANHSAIKPSGYGS